MTALFTLAPFHTAPLGHVFSQFSGDDPEILGLNMLGSKGQQAQTHASLTAVTSGQICINEIHEF